MDKANFDYIINLTTNASEFYDDNKSLKNLLKIESHKQVNMFSMTDLNNRLEHLEYIYSEYLELLSLSNQDKKVLLVLDDVTSQWFEEKENTKILNLYFSNAKILLISKDLIVDKVIASCKEFKLSKLSLESAIDMFCDIAEVTDRSEKKLDIVRLINNTDHLPLMINLLARIWKFEDILTFTEFVDEFNTTQVFNDELIITDYEKEKVSMKNILEKAFQINKIKNISLEVSYLLNILLELAPAQVTNRGIYDIIIHAKKCVAESSNNEYTEILKKLNYKISMNKIKSLGLIDINHKNKDVIIIHGQIKRFLREVDQKLFLLNHNDDLNYSILNTLSSLDFFTTNKHLYLEVFEILKSNIIEKDHPNYIILCNNLAEIYKIKDDCEKVLSLYEEALSIKIKIFGKDHLDYITSCNNLAEIYKSIGEYNKALFYYEEALKITERIFGKYHLEYSASSNNLALLYKSIGEYNKALFYYEEALKIRKSISNRDHSNYATTYANLAKVYRSRGQYSEALISFKEALRIIKETFGIDHPNYLKIKNNYDVLFRIINKKGANKLD